MHRVVILGRGGAGKSTLARALGALTGLPVVELDTHFWLLGLAAPTPGAWTATQEALVAGQRWILDGDLAKHDVLSVRLSAADTVLVLDYPFLLCAWRAARRGHEGRHFWLWVLLYRRRYLGPVLTAIEEHAPTATVHRLTSPRQTQRFLSELR